MHRPPENVASPEPRETADLLEQTRERVEDVEHRRIELRLMVMQAKARIAELKATLRAFRPFGADRER